jgi:hypothetical protein
MAFRQDSSNLGIALNAIQTTERETLLVSESKGMQSSNSAWMIADFSCT